MRLFITRRLSLVQTLTFMAAIMSVSSAWATDVTKTVCAKAFAVDFALAPAAYLKAIRLGLKGQDLSVADLDTLLDSLANGKVLNPFAKLVYSSHGNGLKNVIATLLTSGALTAKDVLPALQNLKQEFLSEQTLTHKVREQTRSILSGVPALTLDPAWASQLNIKKVPAPNGKVWIYQNTNDDARPVLAHTLGRSNEVRELQRPGPLYKLAFSKKDEAIWAGSTQANLASRGADTVELMNASTGERYVYARESDHETAAARALEVNWLANLQNESFALITDLRGDKNKITIVPADDFSKSFSLNLNKELQIERTQVIRLKNGTNALFYSVYDRLNGKTTSSIWSLTAQAEPLIIADMPQNFDHLIFYENTYGSRAMAINDAKHGIRPSIQVVNLDTGTTHGARDVWAGAKNFVNVYTQDAKNSYAIFHGEADTAHGELPLVRVDLNGDKADEHWHSLPTSKGIQEDSLRIYRNLLGQDVAVFTTPNYSTAQTLFLFMQVFGGPHVSVQIKPELTIQLEYVQSAHDERLVLFSYPHVSTGKPDFKFSAYELHAQPPQAEVNP